MSEINIKRVIKLFKDTLSLKASHPDASLSLARKTAETICKQIYLSEGMEKGSKPADKMMLNDLLMTFHRKNIISRYILINLETIRAFGNFGTHDQGLESDFLDEDNIAPCIQALSNVMDWYCDKYQNNLDFTFSCKDTKFNFGDETKALIELQNTESDFNIKIWTRQDESPCENRDIVIIPHNTFSQHRIGDNVTICFHSSEDAYIYLFNIGPTGNVTRLLPNQFSKENRIEKGKVYNFPDEKAGFQWILQEPIGTEIIRGFATKKPVDISYFNNIAEGFTRIDKRDISIVSKSVENIDKKNWTEAVCTIFVQK